MNKFFNFSYGYKQENSHRRQSIQSSLATLQTLRRTKVSANPSRDATEMSKSEETTPGFVLLHFTKMTHPLVYSFLCTRAHTPEIWTHQSWTGKDSFLLKMTESFSAKSALPGKLAEGTLI